MFTLSSQCHALGISWDNRHKRSKTWGERKRQPKTQKDEPVGCPAASSKTGPTEQAAHVQGGNQKDHDLGLDTGNFSWDWSVVHAKQGY